MRIVVTGGTGFIGSNLCGRLLKEAHQVICVDNCLTGPEKNIKEFVGNENFTFIKQDITKSFAIEGEIDQIYNLASPASPVDYFEHSLETMHVNSIGLENMLKMAQEKEARILHTSTSEVYGDPDDNHHPQGEEYHGNVNPYGPRSCYDESKRYGEALIYEYRRKLEIDTVIIRIFNTFGPKMKEDDGRVVSNFISQALRGKDLTIYGSGKQTRSFCYIDDMIEGLLLAMNSEIEGPVNIGNPDEFSINNLADLVIEKVGGGSEKVFKGLGKDDPKQRQPDITKAKNELGFEPKVKLEDGLDKTIKYFRSLIEKES
ncbi:SDR family oxidoreductase [Patescibacteria group bacterium]|nr:SDR family oxidoreductase [Patescibacteria group bacterium]